MEDITQTTPHAKEQLTGVITSSDAGGEKVYHLAVSDGRKWSAARLRDLKYKAKKNGVTLKES